MGRGKEVKELREKMGMNRREFSNYYGIPYRTVQDWEAEKRELPEYLLRLMKYRAEIERKDWFMKYDHKEIIKPDKFFPDPQFIEYHNDVIFQR